MVSAHFCWFKTSKLKPKINQDKVQVNFSFIGRFVYSLAMKVQLKFLLDSFFLLLSIRFDLFPEEVLNIFMTFALSFSLAGQNCFEKHFSRKIMNDDNNFLDSHRDFLTCFRKKMNLNESFFGWVLVFIAFC